MDKYVQFNTLQNKRRVLQLYKVIATLEEGLLDKFGGRFLPDGSATDGTKVGALDEFDYLYEIRKYNPRHLKFERHMTDKHNISYRIYHQDIELSPTAIYNEFADAVTEVLKSIALDDSTRHAGFGSPRFCGIRFSEPAITLLFLVEQDLVSVDMAPGIRLPFREESQYKIQIEEKIAPLRRENSMTPFDLNKKLHLVPIFSEDNKWYVSSSCLEAHILHLLSEKSPLKVSIKQAKVIRNERIHAIWERIVDGKPAGQHMRDASAINEVCHILDEAIKAPQHQDIPEDIYTKMQFQHIALPFEMSRKYNELTKIEVGINTAAIKNLAISKACTISGAFKPIKSEAIERKLLAAIWKDLAANGVYRVRHFFLSYDIRILSMASYAADNWLGLMCITKEQCKQISHKLSAMISSIVPEETEPDLDDIVDTGQEAILDLANKYQALLEEMDNQRVMIQQIYPQWQDEDWDAQIPDFTVNGFDQELVPRPNGRTEVICSAVMRCPIGRKFLDPNESENPPVEDDQGRTSYQKYRQQRVILF